MFLTNNIMSASGQDSITKADRIQTATPPLPPPGRLNFAKTCNLLSQYVKGTKGGVNLAAATGISGLLEATAKSESANMKLLGNREVSSDLATTKCTSSKEDGTVMEHERAPQMTIFYGGKVLVFNDFPADKAKEVMLLAGGYVSPSTTDDVASPANGIAAPPPPPPPAQKGHQQQRHANPSELPTARRSSLHRFLEKRKDRAVARGPYHQHQVQNATDHPSSSKNEEQLELKL